MISGVIRKWICFVLIALRYSVNNSNIDTYSSAEDTTTGIRNYNSNSYRNSSNYSISNSMINIESDNNSNSNSNDSTDDTAMIPTIETTVSAVPTTMNIEILTFMILSLKVPVIFFIIKLIDVYRSITYVIIFIEISNDMSNFIDTDFALLII